MVAGGNASEAKPTKVEVAVRIENWFGAGVSGAAWQPRSGGARSVSWRLGGSMLGSDK